jgi:hypothetical protein
MNTFRERPEKNITLLLQLPGHLIHHAKIPGRSGTVTTPPEPYPTPKQFPGPPNQTSYNKMPSREPGKPLETPESALDLRKALQTSGKHSRPPAQTSGTSGRPLETPGSAPDPREALQTPGKKKTCHGEHCCRQRGSGQTGNPG